MGQPQTTPHTGDDPPHTNAHRTDTTARTRDTLDWLTSLALAPATHNYETRTTQATIMSKAHGGAGRTP